MEKGKGNKPGIRFPAFKDEWEQKRLGEIAEINPKSENLPDTFIYIDLESVTAGELLKETEMLKANAPSRAQRVLKQNDVLFQMVRPYQKNNFYFSKKGNYVASTGYAQLRTEENPLFIYQYLHNQKFVNNVNLRCTGTSYPAINSSDLSNIEIALPTLPEQKRIASFFTAVDKKIAELKQKKALLELYKKGVMKKLFPSAGSGQTPALRFKDENGKEFPGWEKKTIGDVLKIGSGKDYKHLNSGDIPVYGTGGFMTLVDDFLYDGETVCIGRKGTIDAPFYHNGKIWTVDTLFYTYSFNQSVPKFIYYLFQQINWKQHNEASGVPSLSKSTIEKIKINCPSIKEQTKIANFLTSIDEKINQTETQIQQSQEWKKGLLQQMFV